MTMTSAELDARYEKAIELIRLGFSRVTRLGLATVGAAMGLAILLTPTLIAWALRIGDESQALAGPSWWAKAICVVLVAPSAVWLLFGREILWSIAGRSLRGITNADIDAAETRYANRHADRGDPVDREYAGKVVSFRLPDLARDIAGLPPSSGSAR